MQKQRLCSESSINQEEPLHNQPKLPPYKTMTTPFPSLLSMLLLLLIFSPNGEFVRLTEAGQRRVHITDDLDDVIDGEEDEAWKEWGKKKASVPEEFDPPKMDDTMSLDEIQEELMRKHYAPVFGFVKLRLGIPRTPDSVAEIANRWRKVLNTGTIDLKFMVVDVNTMMFNMERGLDSLELKEFLLNQPEVYEVKIGEATFRRTGDPPLEVVVEKLRKEANKEDDAGKPKEEL